MVVDIIIDVILFCIASIPLYFAVKFLNGKTTFLRTILVNLVTGAIIGLLKSWWGAFGWIVGFILLLWVYHEWFRLKWHKAFFAWLLQFIIVALLYMLLVFLGIAAAAAVLAGLA